MTLSTHTVVATAVGAALYPFSPAVAFLAAFASHFALDAVPHWDYKIPAVGGTISGSENERRHLVVSRAFLFDLAKIGFDALLGISIAAAALALSERPVIPFVFVGALGGILPDALQFMYGRFPHEPLTSLQRFHIFVHGRYHISGTLLGIFAQIIFIIPALYFLAR